MVRMFLEVVPITCVAAVLYGAVRRTQIRKSGQPVRPGREVLRLLFVCYLTGLVNLVLVPNNFWTYIWFYLKNGYAGCQVGPLFSGSVQVRSALLGMITGERVAGRWVLEMLAGNLLMFVPMGFFLWALFPKMRGRRIWKLCALIPAVVEGIQPMLGRSFDIDDLVLNGMGILVGYGIAAAIKKGAR